MPLLRSPTISVVLTLVAAVVVGIVAVFAATTFPLRNSKYPSTKIWGPFLGPKPATAALVLVPIVPVAQAAEARIIQIEVPWRRLQSACGSKKLEMHGVSVNVVLFFFPKMGGFQSRNHHSTGATARIATELFGCEHHTGHRGLAIRIILTRIAGFFHPLDGWL